MGCRDTMRNGGGGRLAFPKPEALPEEEWCKEQLLQIYSAHNPSKLPDIDKLLAKYRGRERVLYEKACRKYGVPPVRPTGCSPSGMAAQHKSPDWARAVAGNGQRRSSPPSHSSSAGSSNSRHSKPWGVHPELEHLVTHNGDGPANGRTQQVHRDAYQTDVYNGDREGYRNPVNYCNDIYADDIYRSGDCRNSSPNRELHRHERVAYECREQRPSASRWKDYCAAAESQMGGLCSQTKELARKPRFSVSLRVGGGVFAACLLILATVIAGYVINSGGSPSFGAGSVAAVAAVTGGASHGHQDRRAVVVGPSDFQSHLVMTTVSSTKAAASIISTTVTLTSTSPVPLVTFFTAETRGTPLLDSVVGFRENFNQRVVNAGLDQKWTSYKTKVELLQYWLRTLIDENARAILAGADPKEVGERLVAFVDGSDVFHGGCSEAEFLRVYRDITKASGAKIVFSAEIVCGEQDCNKVPDVPEWATRLGGGKNLEGGFWATYAEGCHGMWTDECAARRDCGGSAPCAEPPAVKFLNSGFFIGPVAEISAMIDWTLLHYDEWSVWGDQSVFAVYWLDHPDLVTLDYNGMLALQLSDLDWKLLEVDKWNSVIWNKGYDRVQCLIHGNGRGIYYMKHLLEDLTNSTLGQLRKW